MAYVGIILKEGDKFLIQLRDNKREIANPERWGLFGGGIEGNESPREAIKREIEEELCLELKDNKLREIYRKGSNFGFYYILTKDERENLRLMEGQKIGKFTIKEILKLKNITPGTREAFLKISNKKLSFFS